MRATILPSAIILTKAHRAKGCIVASSTVSDVFLVFTTQLYSY